MNYIECINVDYTSTRKESFYGRQPGETWSFFSLFYQLRRIEFFVYLFSLTDLALDVKGCSDVYASFDKYVAVERLEGDNKYQSEEHGLQVSSTWPCYAQLSNAM